MKHSLRRRCLLAVAAIATLASFAIAFLASPSTRVAQAQAPLTWSPPSCGGGGYTCQTLNVVDTGSHQSLALDGLHDWRIVLPSTPIHGGIDIGAGHNVILIGGEIDLDPSCAGDNSPCHGINVSGSSAGGEVYIEGVLIKNPGGGNPNVTGDGIDFNNDPTAPWANITLQNIRVEGLQGCDSGTYAGAHADVFQPYQPSSAVIQVDHLTGTTAYQGMQIDPDMNFPTSRDVRNTNINVINNVVPGCTGNIGRYAWWVAGGPTWCGAPPTTFTNDYAQEPSGSIQYNSVWPDTNAQWTGCAGSYSAGAVTWPQIPNITGGIHNGLPPGGDYVPVGVAGISYVSPGYVGQSAPPTARFTYTPANPVTGQPVTFNGSASTCAATPCTYVWTDDACPSPCGDLGTGNPFSFTFSDVGTKHVRLTVTDNLAQTGTVEHDVVVAAPTGSCSLTFNGVTRSGTCMQNQNGTITFTPS